MVQDFIESARKNGGIAMVMDGVQLERGNSVLCVIQDALTSKVLYADYLYDGISDNITSIISIKKEKVDHCCIPVIAFINDHRYPFDWGWKRHF